MAYGILSELASGFVTVSEAALARGLLLCLERAKQVVEPSGAAAVAALLSHPGEFEPPIVAVLSGGNIDPLLGSKLLRHGLSAAGLSLTADTFSGTDVPMLIIVTLSREDTDDMRRP